MSDADYYRRNAERIKARERAKYAANKTAIRARRRVLATPTLRATNSRREKDRYATIRGEMLDAFKRECGCCGEDEVLFLELTYIGPAAKSPHRKRHLGSVEAYRAAKRDRWSRRRWSLLCANCNRGRRRNGGVCPHVR